jgi:hypothetical protein
MGTAKAINLKVRPLQSVDLCFQVDGILGTQPDIHLLGKPVTKFDLPSLYQSLGDPQSASNLGRLKYDSQTIQTAVQASILFALRAESVKAALDKAIAQRENSFYQKYNNQSTIITQMQQIYGNNPTSKPTRLDALAKVSQQMHDALSTEYVNDNRTAVVKVTTSDSAGTSTSNGQSNSTNSGTTTETSTSSGTSGATATASKTNSTDTTSGSSQATNSGKGTSTQHTDNKSYDYRHPSLENEAQYQRAQVSLLDEQFSQFMFGQNLPFLNIAFTNELKAIDLDVKRLQVAFLDTILLSPIDGVVSGVFRDLGDCVRAGQPVIRVDNDVEVLLVGTIKYRGLIAIGTNVSITTDIYDSGTTLSTSGVVVSVRGHDSEEEQWDLLIQCPNRDVHGNPIFPINYNFDFDDTDIVIT